MTFTPEFSGHYCTGCGAGRTRKDHAAECPKAYTRGGPVRGKLDSRLVEALHVAKGALDAIPPDRWRAMSIGLMRKLARDHPKPEMRKLAGEVVADMDREAGGCTCQECGHRYRVDVMVPDALWEKIKPKGAGPGAGLLCGLCIAARLEGFGEFGVFTLAPM